MSQIYLDYNATTPIDAEVLDAMMPYLRSHFGNPSSTHGMGRTAHLAIEEARAQVAGLLGANPSEILFTSGGTESNNLAIKGALLTGSPWQTGHLIISAVEHPATVEPARFLEQLGFSLTIVPVDRSGQVDPGAVAAAIRDDTRLVSIMHANNEIGTIQPIAEIARICRSKGVLVHTDAAQSIGKAAALVDQLEVDLLSVAGHKMYAPKGIGALYVRDGTRLDPVQHGAAHERGLRPGTENTPYIVGLGKASALAQEKGAVFQERMQKRSDQLRDMLDDALGDQLTQNGAIAPRLPNTLSLNFAGVIGGELLAAVPELCASTGSACHSGTTNMSSTLQAIGLTPDVARGTIRLSVGWHTTEEEVTTAAALLAEAWTKVTSAR